VENEILNKVGTQIRFGNSPNPSDSGTDWTIGTPTDVTLSLSGLADGAGRQSDKVDLGATRAMEYEVLGCVDFTEEQPSAAGTVDYYWAPSTNTNTYDGNVAGNSGEDAPAPDGAVGSPTLAEFLKLCVFIGPLNTHDGAGVQNGFVGILRPTGRYGQLIVVNNGGDAFEESNTQAHQVFNPIVAELQ